MQAVPYQTIVPIARQEIETSLKEFIQSALQQSCSGDCSHQEAMALLDRAWKSQKLLWQMRREESAITPAGNCGATAIELQVSFSIEPQILQPVLESLQVRE